MSQALLKLAVVALGGALGAGLRYLSVLAVYAWLGRGFPYGTLLVNAVGSLAIGYLASLLPSAQEPLPLLQLLLITGLLGGFTTFSAFSMETLFLLQTGQAQRAGLNIALMLVLCFSAVWLGYGVGKSLHGPA